MDGSFNSLWLCIQTLVFMVTSIFEACGFPSGASDKESACQCRRLKRHGFNPWVGKIPWSRKWQPTQVFLPGKFHGQRSLAGCSPWGHKKSDTTEQLSVHKNLVQEIDPEYSLEGLMLKLKLPYFGHLMPTADSLEKILMLGKIEGKRRRWQRMRLLDGIADSMDMNLSKFLEIGKDREAWHAAVCGGHKESDMTYWLDSNNFCFVEWVFVF